MNKTLLSYLLIIGIAGVAGASTGVILKRTMGPVEEMYPPGFSPDLYRDDTEKLYNDYMESHSIQGLTNSDIVNIALEKYKRCDNCYSLGIGVANTMGIGQTIRNAQIKVGNEYFEESISYSSMVKLADRANQHGKDGYVDYYHSQDSQVSGAETASYPAVPTARTKIDYKSTFGKSLDEMFIYIISNQTVVSSTRNEVGGDYRIVLELDYSISTYYYKIQMQNISGLSSLPPFSKVKQTYTISKDLTLKHAYMEETYVATKASIPVPASVNATIDYYYYADEEIQIPQYNEMINYNVQ